MNLTDGDLGCRARIVASCSANTSADECGNLTEFYRILFLSGHKLELVTLAEIFTFSWFLSIPVYPPEHQRKIVVKINSQAVFHF